MRKSYLDEEEDLQLAPEEEAFAFSFGEQQPSIRLTGVYGHVCEERAAEVVYTLWALKPKEEDEEPLPIDFLVSTYGGSTDEMFSIYDTMTMVREKCQINTFGRGKVKSAGVLLLASGTKGCRKIGKYCHVMIHDIAVGMEGKYRNIKLEQKQLEVLRNDYINALVSETNITRRQLLAMFKKGNVYISAEQAIKYGIADEIG